MNNKLFCIISSVLLIAGSIACKKQLQVGNPNQPTVAGNTGSEAGIIALAQGGVYINGFENGDVWLGDSYFSLPYGYSELLADIVGADASNQQISGVGLPQYVILSDGTKLTNPTTQRDLLRTYNSRSSTGQGNNAYYYQWLNMYALNNACNVVLSLLDGVKFSGDATTRSNTIKVWCYWWKGYAYASIGSMYYSGLISSDPNTTNNHYVIKDSIIKESDYWYNQAATILQGITNTTDYNEVLGQLIPAFCQVGHGGVLTPDMWIHNINTMLARNILLNKLAPFVNSNPNTIITGASITPMTSADWQDVLTLATKGIQNSDYVFTGRSTDINGFFSAAFGTVASLTAGVNTSTTFKITERFIQYFKPGDKRLTNNFDASTHYHNDYTFGTRWSLLDGGKSLPGVYTYANQNIGEYELYIAGSYEENALMLAEANIRLSKIDAGLAYVDAIRNYQSAGLPAVSGRGLNQAQALSELVSERRVSLVFRGLSFYDSRRWGWIYDISHGGGSYGNWLLTSDDVLHTNVTIDYNFLDYWDVPADESDLNPPGEGSAPILNPN
ncbi:MAG: RagB/SusD family nutrient uptake outer membrane protein [Chitinophagaceae bacterium]